MTPPTSTTFALPATVPLAWYLRAIQQVGFPIVVAAVLMWMILKDVPGNAAAASREAAATRVELAAYIAESRVAMTRISLEDAERTIDLMRVMQQICVNTATAGERDRCFP